MLSEEFFPAGRHLASKLKLCHTWLQGPLKWSSVSRFYCREPSNGCRLISTSSPVSPMLRAGKEDLRPANFPDSTIHPAQGFCPTRPRTTPGPEHHQGQNNPFVWRDMASLGPVVYTLSAKSAKRREPIAPKPYEESEGEKPGLMIQEPK